ncbi:hypothetical protein [Tsukamurella sp. 1534]|uniref:hypothetical protein n=1 Tax=Tsukamurella sp. 1534 TaxID=1151061 RepID=UPI000592CAD8|nr:hypothetical protein [Tsukamurella sp. 1534]
MSEYRVRPARTRAEGGASERTVTVATTLPDGEVLVIPVADMSRQHDAEALGRAGIRPKPGGGQPARD